MLGEENSRRNKFQEARTAELAKTVYLLQFNDDISWVYISIQIRVPIRDVQATRCLPWPTVLL